MTDQLDGAYFSRLLGLSGVLPRERVQRVLESVWRYNYSQENGLVNASCPPGKQSTLHTFRNCQGLANWSGIEYMMAAFYLMNGRYGQGLQIVENVWERHVRLGQVWNHAECGDHYYRPLSAWALLQALSGVAVHGADRALLWTDAAWEGDFRCPWFSSTGYGVVYGGRRHRRLVCLWGEVSLERIKPPDGTALTAAEYNAVPLPFRTGRDAGEIFLEPVILRSGDTLDLRLSS